MCDKMFKELKNTKLYWKPNVKDDLIEGKIIDIEETQDFGTQYTIDDSRLGKISTPSHKQLQGTMKRFDVKRGDKVRITFLGTELPKIKGQNPMCKYKVERDE